MRTLAPSRKQSCQTDSVTCVPRSRPLAARSAVSAGLRSPCGPLTHDFSRMTVLPASAGTVQAKPAANSPGDAYEQEADHVAERVMKMPGAGLQRACACGGGCPKCQTASQDQGATLLPIRRVQAGSEGQSVVPSTVDEVLRTPGQPLDSQARVFFEPRFGHDFSRVRVHADARAGASARHVNALAYTVGNHVVFGDNQYNSGTVAGQRLLAHELTHVVQQGAVERPAGSIPLAFGSPHALMRADDGDGGEAGAGTAPRHSGCTQDQIDEIEDARRAAAIRCQRAGFQTKGIVPPGRGGRDDPAARARLRARAMARRIFGQAMNMEQVGDIVMEMGHRLAGPSLTFTCAPQTDSNCGSRAGYVVGNRPPVYLCPGFFGGSAEDRIRTMVHEAAHVAGIGEAMGETYCPIFDCDSTCGGFDVADSWSHFVHCMSGQTPDQPETVTGGSQ